MEKARKRVMAKWERGGKRSGYKRGAVRRGRSRLVGKGGEDWVTIRKQIDFHVLRWYAERVWKRQICHKPPFWGEMKERDGRERRKGE